MLCLDADLGYNAAPSMVLQATYASFLGTQATVKCGRTVLTLYMSFWLYLCLYTVDRRSVLPDRYFTDAGTAAHGLTSNVAGGGKQACLLTAAE
jgi:hypothetical protein